MAAWVVRHAQGGDSLILRWVAYKGRVHVIVPFVGRNNGDLIACQQSYNVLVLSSLG